MVNPPSSPGDIDTPSGSGTNQTEVPTTSGTAPLIATDFFTFGCSNQAAGVKNLWGGQKVTNSYLDEFFGISALLDFFNGRFFSNKKSYRNLLIERLNNPELINGVFTFNFVGSAEIFSFPGDESGSVSTKYRFAYQDKSDTVHYSNIYSNGQNTDITVTDCKPGTLTIYLFGENSEYIYHGAVRASADFHLMWVFTPTSPSSL